MGELVDFLAYKRQKELRTKIYTAYNDEKNRLCPVSTGIAVTRYEFTLEGQLDGDYFLYKYWFPDYDW